MEKKDIFQSVLRMEEQLGKMYHQLGEFKEHIATLLEENHFLQLENEHLKEQLQQSSVVTKEIAKKPQNTEKKTKKKDVGEGYDNLARIYEEGFHICHVEYGSLRKQGDCIFCLSLLNGNKQQ